MLADIPGDVSYSTYLRRGRTLLDARQAHGHYYYVTRTGKWSACALGAMVIGYRGTIPVSDNLADAMAELPDIERDLNIDTLLYRVELAKIVEFSQSLVPSKRLDDLGWTDLGILRLDDILITLNDDKGWTLLEIALGLEAMGL